MRGLAGRRIRLLNTDIARRAAMNMMIAFAPFAAFAVVEHLAGALPGLCAAALVSALLLVRDVLSPRRGVKLLELGSLFLFSGLAVIAAATDAHWSRLGVRLRVDTGLCLIVLLSLAIRRPFTLAYTKAHAPEAAWSTPRFRRLNDVLTAGWALAFAALAGIDAAMLYTPTVPRWAGIAATAAALTWALRFSRRHIGRAKAQSA
jgi:hypothetical protein